MLKKIMDFLEDEFTWTWLGVAAIAAFLMAVFVGVEYVIAIPIVVGVLIFLTFMAHLLRTRPIYGILASILVIYLINDFLYG